MLELPTRTKTAYQISLANLEADVRVVGGLPPPWWLLSVYSFVTDQLRLRHTQTLWLDLRVQGPGCAGFFVVWPRCARALDVFWVWGLLALGCHVQRGLPACDVDILPTRIQNTQDTETAEARQDLLALIRPPSSPRSYRMPCFRESASPGQQYISVLPCNSCL